MFSIKTVAGHTGQAAVERGTASGHGRPWLVAAIALAVLLVGLVLAGVSGLFDRGEQNTPLEPPRGRAEASALYEAAGKFSRVDVYRQRDEAQQDVFLVAVTDMLSGALLAEPQTWRIDRQHNRAYLRNFSDGQLYLQLEKQRVLRFDPGAYGFVDLSPELIARHPDQLGGGIAEIEFSHRDRPDSFKITGADGTVYYAYWLAGQLLPDATIVASDRQRAAQASGVSEHWGYAELSGGSSDNRCYLLLRYWQRADPGQPQYLGYFSLYRQDSTDIQRFPRHYQQMTEDLWVAGYARDTGLERLQAIAPVTPRFHAQVLAQNPSHLLLVYSPTPASGTGRVVQLLDKHSQQVVWSREVAQVPLMASDRGGTYLTAQGLPSGFFVQSSSLEPGFLMDNQGNVLHAFQ